MNPDSPIVVKVLEKDTKVHSTKKLLIAFVLLVSGLSGLAQSAIAAPSQKPTQSVSTNADAKKFGIYANTDEGAKLCLSDLTANEIIFYQPTDLRGFDSAARTAPLEKSDCWRMRVKGGLLGIVALKEGSLVNIGLRSGREQPVAYNPCNNYLEALATAVPAVAAAPIDIPPAKVIVEVRPAVTEREVIDTVIVRRRTIVKYIDETVYEQAPTKTISVPETDYRYVNRPAQRELTQKRCVCYWPPGDPSVTQLYHFPYSDSTGQEWCVPLHMAQNKIEPPGFAR